MALFDISHTDHAFNNKWFNKMKTKHKYPIWSKHMKDINFAQWVFQIIEIIVQHQS